MHTVCMNSPIGNIYITEENNEIVSITTAKSEGTETCDICELAIKELREYFAKERTSFTFPITEKGTDFQKKVWAALREIPYGKVRSYGEVAKMIGNPKASRAIGSACHHNPNIIITPCHRVVAANGQLGGFGCGVDNKVILLNLEGVQL